MDCLQCSSCCLRFMHRANWNITDAPDAQVQGHRQTGVLRAFADLPPFAFGRGSPSSYPLWIVWNVTVAAYSQAHGIGHVRHTNNILFVKVTRKTNNNILLGKSSSSFFLTYNTPASLHLFKHPLYAAPSFQIL